VALAALHLPPHTPSTKPPALAEELKSGLRYVRDTRLMLTLTVLVVISTFLAMPLLTFLPAFAADAVTGGGRTETRLSLLMASQGIGAIVGALVVGSRADSGTWRVCAQCADRARHPHRRVLAVHRAAVSMLRSSSAACASWPCSR
jgi:predicted MFS family arabinose efflux permease